MVLKMEGNMARLHKKTGQTSTKVEWKRKRVEMIIVATKRPRRVVQTDIFEPVMMTVGAAAAAAAAAARSKGMRNEEGEGEINRPRKKYTVFVAYTVQSSCGLDLVDRHTDRQVLI